MWLLLACAPAWEPGTQSGALPGDDTGAPEETAAPGESDTQVEETEESATDSDEAGATHAWRFTSLRVSGRTAGFDLDGDATPDNAASQAASLLDPLLAAGVAGGPGSILQLAGVSGADDPYVRFAVLGPEDPVDQAGDAVEATVGELVGGGYLVTVPQAELHAGTFLLPSVVPLRLYGDMAETHEGAMGLVLSVDTLAALAKAAGQTSEEVAAVTRIADLDCDGEVGFECVSASLDYVVVE